jgi:hypothetical protein
MIFEILVDLFKIQVCRNQYSETNVMHFLFNVLRNKGLYMFRALLVHSQEALYKRHLVHCVRVMSVGCTRFGVGSPLESRCSQLT